MVPMYLPTSEGWHPPRPAGNGTRNDIPMLGLVPPLLRRQQQHGNATHLSFEGGGA